MQRLPKQIVPAIQLTNAVVSYYSVPANTITTISAMSLINTTAGAVTATVHLVASAGSPSAANMILSARTIAAGESYNVSSAIGQSLPAGAMIQALSGANTSITFVASGYETNP